MADRPPLRGDGRAGRQRLLLAYLRVSAMVALAAGVTGTLVAGDLGRRASAAALVVLVSAPIGRVLWLAVRWTRKGDRRFAGAAAALLAVVAAGAGIAAL